ncbi:protein GVQW3-like isoform X1 [Coccinella septempunctata]|uniref:protein GVQW3-like isoform X1 n=1 Tax=Coccinella septempunctata TaxID=41139 RepID=UPI001D06B867|nr:protein GVQW3-like isoform X1 [Coccinella septempunctata]
MLKKAFVDNCMSKTQAYDWYKSFKDGREVVEDLPRSGRPSTSTTDDNIIQIKKLVLENRHSSVRELARELSIDKMTVHNILTNVLCMKRVAAKLVPKELNFLQKEHRKQVSEDMVSRAASDPNFMKRIITGDETWVYEYDTLTAQQSTEWRLPNEPNPKKPQIRNEN